jgi:5-methylcytosine-specific restriction endonuclease McrA
MHATLPASLDSTVLSRRLGELAGHEREVQVEFLLHLAEFDRREAYREAGYASLWEYCLRALHLREGAAGRRIAAMRVLRRLPVLEAPLRDGRLCLSTVALLGPLLAEDNVAELVARAAFKTKSEIEHLVVSLQPRSAPKDGLRRLPERRDLPSAAALPLSARPPQLAVASAPATSEAAMVPAVPPVPAAGDTRPTVRPVAADTYSLRVTLDAALKRELDQLTALLSHKIPNGDLASVLREAIHCALEKHGKRKGAVAPARKTNRTAAAHPPAAREAGKGRAAIPVEVRREVWKRDEGKCTWRSPDGHRCGSSWRVELDHIHPAALGGPATLANLRLLCGAHNKFHAEQIFGLAHMAQFRHRPPRAGEATSAGDSCAVAAPE